MYLLKDEFFKTETMKLLFSVELAALLVLEVLILLLVIHNYVKRRGKTKSMDNGSGVLLFLGVVGTILVQPLCVKGFGFLMPAWVFYIGFVNIIIGLILRIIGVVSLRKEYSYLVVVEKNGTLRCNGIRKWIRNPAYLGSFLILIGISFVYRCPLGLFFCLVNGALVYGYRIGMEEQALKKQFGVQYSTYEQDTFCVIPFLW